MSKEIRGYRCDRGAARSTMRAKAPFGQAGDLSFLDPSLLRLRSASRRRLLRPCGSELVVRVQTDSRSERKKCHTLNPIHSPILTDEDSGAHDDASDARTSRAPSDVSPWSP